MDFHGVEPISGLRSVCSHQLSQQETAELQKHFCEFPVCKGYIHNHGLLHIIQTETHIM